LKWFQKVVSAGALPPDYRSLGYQEHDARIASGKVGLAAQNWAYDTINFLSDSHSVKINTPEADWRVVPPLKATPESQIHGYPGYSDHPGRFAEAIVITSACKDPELAFKFLDYVHYSPEGRIVNNYGLEGKSYKVENGKKVFFIDSDFYNYKPESDGLWWGREVFEIVQDDEFMEAQRLGMGLSEDVPAYRDLVANWPTLEPYYAMETATGEDGAEATALLTDIKTYRDEMWAKFCEGLDVDSNWDEYVSTQKSMGLDRLIELYQKGYDALH
jgi:putative aldouronate transport system substrate-binding protein